MPVEVSWYLEGRIIIVHYYGDVTIDDKRICAEEEYRLLDDGTVPLVHTLLDITEQTSSPTQINDIQKALDKVLKHPKKGWTIAYGQEDSTMENFVRSVVMQSYSLRYRVFATMKEALSFLIYVDSSLKDLIEI